jgi:DNA-binding NarL/FixJ family response regulator
MGGQLLADVLRRDKHLHVADATGSSVEAILAAPVPDVVLVSEEIAGGPGNGFDVLRTFRASYPKVRVVMLLDHGDRDLVLHAFRSGARGVFCRCDPLNRLTKCVRAVHGNQIWISGPQLEFVMKALSEAPSTNLVGVNGQVLLSKRERQVVHCLIEGLSNKEIAHELQLSEHTIKNYLFSIFNKLGVSSRVEVVLYAASQRTSFERDRLKIA